MVFRIAIVEDERESAALLARQVGEWSADANRVTECATFERGEALLFAWEDASFDAVFLDVGLPGADGLAIAEELRQRDAGVPIIFLTNARERVQEGYGVRALDYLYKPPDKRKVFRCLNAAAAEAEARPDNSILLRCDGQDVLLWHREARYFENALHYIVAHTAREGLRFKMNMDALEKALPPKFLRCHRSFLVNADYIYSLGSREILLRDLSTRIPISAGRLTATQAAFARSRGGVFRRPD